MNPAIENIVTQLNIPTQYSSMVSLCLFLSMVITLALIGHYIARLFILRLVEKWLLKTASLRDDILVKRHVFRRLVHIVPALIMFSMAQPLIDKYPNLGGFISTSCQLYMLIMITLFLDALINALLEIYRSYDISRHVPIKSFAQVLKLILYFIAIVAGVSLILGKSPLQLIAGLGAMTAVLMLVFKDPILGFIAGLQLTTNRMVSRGDWIEVPQHGVDGDVLDIALTTVKIKNFDNTITTLPTQALINNSFKNWAGMQESGGRRIKRAVNIDLSTVRFCNEEMLQRFSKIQYISEYIDEKRKELTAYNHGQEFDLSALANGRRLTNLGTFRAYIEAYLKHHPAISKNLTFLVRQLKTSETGVPIEIYVFSNEKRWVQYEGIQSDIFDHILAVIPEFDLRVFQSPSGHSLSSLKLASSILEPH